MKDKLIEIILWLGFVATACVFVGPSFIDSLYNIRQVQTIGSYSEEVDHMDRLDIELAFERAEAYNETVAAAQAVSSFYYQGAEATDPEYESILMMGSSSNIMGYIEVPSADIYLPIAHGTDTETLQSEAGHMYGTSLPVGGDSTHAVIAGHTGLKSADLFTHLTKTQEGDVFYVHVLDEIHEYTVDQIVVVLPEEEDPYLQVVTGEDYVSLYTCTPYGINDHRLIVRGRRSGTIENAAQSGGALRHERINREAIIHTILFAGIPVIVFIAGGLYIFLPRKKKKKNGTATQEDQDACEQSQPSHKEEENQ